MVVDCTNLSSYQAHLLSRRAADALAVAVETGGRWQVTPRRQVRREIEARGFALPLSSAHAQLLGDVLNASFALRSRIESCEISDDGAKVKLALAVELMDVRTGEAVWAETQEATARASRRETLILDAKVGEALADAAQATARKLPTFRRVRGMVYSLLRRRQALVSLGRQHGLKKGMELAVYREGYDENSRATTLTQVGRVKVVELGPTDSTVIILKGSQPLDRHDVIHAMLAI
ncbi:MAG: hypothetical protein ACE5JM_07855, partial [Armatimonadota bacterium]